VLGLESDVGMLSLQLCSFSSQMDRLQPADDDTVKHGMPNAPLPQPPHEIVDLMDA
jgi:hypothetical protein